jgi:hypothetical protein
MSGLGFIASQPDEVCEMCGKVDECRPYGPNDENICFDCAMTKVGEETVNKKMAKHIFGEDDS